VYGPQPAMNEFADVPLSSGLRISADVDADHPRAGSAANNLASLAS
jgi:hypothetical protein